MSRIWYVLAHATCVWYAFALALAVQGLVYGTIGWGSPWIMLHVVLPIASGFMFMHAAIRLWQMYRSMSQLRHLTRDEFLPPA